MSKTSEVLAARGMRARDEFTVSEFSESGREVTTQANPADLYHSGGIENAP